MNLRREATEVTSVRAIYEDLLGDLWIGTYGGGVSLYNADSDSFAVERHVANQAGSPAGWVPATSASQPATSASQPPRPATSISHLGQMRHRARSRVSSSSKRTRYSTVRVRVKTVLQQQIVSEIDRSCSRTTRATRDTPTRTSDTPLICWRQKVATQLEDVAVAMALDVR